MQLKTDKIGGYSPLSGAKGHYAFLPDRLHSESLSPPTGSPAGSIG
ncbi:MAG: hypothetical protein KIT80_17300 [Chitinophagaceae bacterium]|nr:hypothetical protein [Chitinophagaceae bacterium]MCW5928679.1 hypothetical protein [Chitinophagaceae bacterium]